MRDPCDEFQNLNVVKQADLVTVVSNYIVMAWVHRANCTFRILYTVLAMMTSILSQIWVVSVSCDVFEVLDYYQQADTVFSLCTRVLLGAHNQVVHLTHSKEVLL